MIERLIEQLRQERRQRETVLLSAPIRDWEAFLTVRAEYRTLDLAIDMAMKLAASDDEEDWDNGPSDIDA